VRRDTPWRAGRLDASTGPTRLLFGETYEDAEIELAAFAGKQRVFCIASAGTTALRLSDEHEVIACDINPTQLAYAERRAAGAPAEKGDAERALSVARAFMPLVGWRTDVVRDFLDLADACAQAAFWKRHLDTQRFRFGFDTLLSPPILRAMYARSFLSFLPARFGAAVRNRLERGFARHQNATNPYARVLLLGESASEPARRRANIGFVHADAASFLESCPAGSFEGFSLSNILDGAAPAYRSRLLRALQHAAAPGAMIVVRSFAEPDLNLQTNRAEFDRSLLWGIVDVRSIEMVARSS
jgi:S-adenosylmethionine:diacylglycerol 3-amino-3-carboxypropyl transferase